MPNGWCRPDANVNFSSASSDPPLPRSKVMRSALPLMAPARRCSRELHRLADGFRFAGYGTGFRHQRVAVRQNIKPARMVQAGGITRHLEAVGSDRCLAGGPRFGLREIDRGNEALVGLRQRRIGADEVAVGRRRLSAENSQSKPRSAQQTTRRRVQMQKFAGSECGAI